MIEQQLLLEGFVIKLCLFLNGKPVFFSYGKTFSQGYSSYFSKLLSNCSRLELIRCLNPLHLKHQNIIYIFLSVREATHNSVLSTQSSTQSNDIEEAFKVKLLFIFLSENSFVFILKFQNLKIKDTFIMTLLMHHFIQVYPWIFNGMIFFFSIFNI